MNNVDVAARGWSIVGETTNMRFFDVGGGVLAAVPLAGAVDDEATAAENLAFQAAYFRGLGAPGLVIVLMDGLVSQDKDARRIYRESGEPFVRAVGLVASSLLGRAIASFSIGIRKPKVPMKHFTTLDEAIEWAREFRSSPPSARGRGEQAGTS